MVAANVDDNHDDDDDVRSLAVQLIKADKSRVKRSDNIADTDARRAGRSGRSGRRVEQAGGGGRRGGGGKRRWCGGAEVSECLDEAARGGEVVGGSRKGRWAQIVGAWASGGERRGAGGRRAEEGRARSGGSGGVGGARRESEKPSSPPPPPPQSVPPPPRGQRRRDQWTCAGVPRHHGDLLATARNKMATAPPNVAERWRQNLLPLGLLSRSPTSD